MTPLATLRLEHFRRGPIWTHAQGGGCMIKHPPADLAERVARRFGNPDIRLKTRSGARRHIWYLVHERPHRPLLSHDPGQGQLALIATNTSKTTTWRVIGLTGAHLEGRLVASFVTALTQNVAA